MKFYRYTIDEVMNLDVYRYNTLVRLMYINEARDTLRDFDVASYTKLKDDGRKQLHKKYYKIAYPASFQVKNTVKLGDLSRVLNG